LEKQHFGQQSEAQRAMDSSVNVRKNIIIYSKNGDIRFETGYSALVF
jgi:hypothetical protein